MTAAQLIYGLLGLCCVVTIGHLLERRWLKGQRFDQQAQVEQEIRQHVVRISSLDYHSPVNDDAHIHHHARAFVRASKEQARIARFPRPTDVSRN